MQVKWHEKTDMTFGLVIELLFFPLFLDARCSVSSAPGIGPAGVAGMR